MSKETWNKLKSVPDWAKKPIQAGRLKGMTDIKPQWRFEIMTEVFGQVGFGWYYDVTNKWIETGADGNVCAFVDVNLFVKNGEEWSKPIMGTGGSSFVAKESKGMYTSDECYKMALTDALSVAMKALGVGADVYNGHGGKYDKPEPQKEVFNNKHPRWVGAVGALRNGKTTIEEIKKTFPDITEEVIIQLKTEAGIQ